MQLKPKYPSVSVRPARLMRMAGAVLMLGRLLLRHSHLPQHGRTAGVEEADHERGGKREEDDVQDGGEVPTGRLLDDGDGPVARDEAKGAEQDLDNIPGDRHHSVKGHQNV